MIHQLQTHFLTMFTCYQTTRASLNVTLQMPRRWQMRHKELGKASSLCWKGHGSLTTLLVVCTMAFIA